MVFVVTNSREYITEEKWNSTLILSSKTLDLCLLPEFAVAETLYQLQSPDPKDKKNSVFKLRTYLTDPPFAEVFVREGGIEILTTIVLSAKGNLLSYSLADYPMAMQHSDWALMPSEVMAKVIESMSSPKNNVINQALAIVTGLCKGVDPVVSPHVGQMIHEQFNASGPDSFIVLARHINSDDLDIQVECLEAVNGIIRQTTDSDSLAAFFAVIDGFGFNASLKSQVNATDLASFREAAVLYQDARLYFEKRLLRTNFESDNDDHDLLLLRYWAQVFPSDVLSELSDWRRLGFQTTDPSSELRTTGMLGIHCCRELMEKSPTIGRGIVDAQTRRPERDYPFSAAWISVVAVMVELFSLARERIPGEPGEVFLCLLDDTKASGDVASSSSSKGVSMDDVPIGMFGGSPFLEVFSILVQAYDKMWNDLNCTYEDFNKANAVIRAKLAQALKANPESLSGLKRAVFLMATGLKKRIGAVDQAFAAMGLRVAEAPIVEELRKTLTTSMLDLVAWQRMENMKSGGVFASYRQDGKNVKQFTVKVILGESGQDIRFCIQDGDTSSSSGALTATMPGLEPVFFQDIHSIAVGASSPMVMALKKPDPAMTELAFSIVLKTPTASGEMTVDCVARERREYVMWTDGLRALTGQPLVSPEAVADAEKLAEMELRVRMVELDSVDVPSGEPDLPPPPPSSFSITPEEALSIAGIRSGV